MKVQLKKEFDGIMLDIGGGGEGIIGQAYDKQVIAIDNLKDELDEAPITCKKLLMDATALEFENDSFDHVTSFFTMMYMAKATQKQAISEAYRVLKPGGLLHIWDANIISAYPEPFCVDLDIDLNGQTIHTTYGIVKDDAKQDAAHFITLCKNAGFSLEEMISEDEPIILCFRKIN